MFYERKIKYLDYYENGIRIKGGGFVKLEAREESLRMELTVSGLHATDSYDRDVILCGKEREEVIGKIMISGGKGQYRQMCFGLDNICGAGIGYGELQGIRIPLGAGREISCSWKAAAVQGNALKRGEVSAAENIPDSGKMGANGEGGRMEKNEQDGRKGIGIWGKRQDDRESGEIERKRQDGQEGADIWGNRQDDREGGEIERKRQDSRESSDIWGKRQDDRESAETEKKKQDSWEDDNIERKRQDSRESSEIERKRQNSRESSEIERKRQNSRESSEIERKRQNSKESINVERKGQDSQGDSVVERERQDGREGSNERRRQDSRESGSIDRRKQESQEGVSITEKGRETSRDNGITAVRGAGMKQMGNSDGRSGSAGQHNSPVKLMEDKWQQLWAIYPHVHPFRDKREYLSIGPADFVLFPAASYRTVNNSFLLHGYYNYNHLILTRMEKKGEILYYIGVPGNYYEREKQVAIMFGFESFECAEEPAQTGDFGYYMMRTEL